VVGYRKAFHLMTRRCILPLKGGMTACVFVAIIGLWAHGADSAVMPADIGRQVTMRWPAEHKWLGASVAGALVSFERRMGVPVTAENPGTPYYFFPLSACQAARRG
jgi:hypothetical protein